MIVYLPASIPRKLIKIAPGRTVQKTSQSFLSLDCSPEEYAAGMANSYRSIQPVLRYMINIRKK